MPIGIEIITINSPPNSDGTGIVVLDKLLSAGGTATRGIARPVEVRVLSQVGPPDPSVDEDYVLANGTTAEVTASPMGPINWSSWFIDSAMVGATNTCYAAIHWTDGAKEMTQSVFAGVDLLMPQLKGAAKGVSKSKAKSLRSALKKRGIRPKMVTAALGGESGIGVVRIMDTREAPPHAVVINGKSLRVDSADLHRHLLMAHHSGRKVFYRAPGGTIEEVVSF